MSTPKMWSISGTIPRAKLSPQYRVAMFFAALGMILLPLIYLGLLGWLGWWLYDLANSDAVPVGRSGRHRSGDNFIPLFVGAVVLVFMIKPLFSRRPKSVQPRILKPEEEPELFEFINRIAELVGAPKPKRVQVDLQVNASASLTHGFWSLFSRNLTLTIGMPLAGGLSARELGGVMAHEFGHFAQGAGMVTTYVVRVVSMWFARVVYERDRVDELIESWSRNSDFRIMLLLWICRIFIWLGRRALWVLMMVGQLISSVLLRQMEFDADHYEIQASGSDAFISTARRLRALSLGSQIAYNRMGESLNARRLVDDFAGYMLHEADSLSEDSLKKLREAVAEEKTGWLDTHPSDTQRIAAAERDAATGVLHSDAKGSALFADFGALCREVTARFYKEVAKLEISAIALVPLAEVTEESTSEKRGAEAMEKFFGEMLSPRTMVFLKPEQIIPGDPDLVSRNLATRSVETAPHRQSVKDLNETFGRFWSVRSIIALNTAKIPVKKDPDLKLKSTKTPDLLLESNELISKMSSIEESVAPALDNLRLRMAAALGHLLYRTDTPEAVKTEVRKYIATLRCLAGIHEHLSALRNDSIGVGAVLNSLDNASDHAAVHRVVSDGTVAMQPRIRMILDATQEIAYPFPHAGGTIKLAAYLTSDVSHGDPMILTYLRGSTIVDRIFSVYSRIMGRLSMLAFEAEAKMDADRSAIHED